MNPFLLLFVVSFVVSSAYTPVDMMSVRRSRLLCRHGYSLISRQMCSSGGSSGPTSGGSGSKGFGKKVGSNYFPSIDAFSKDPNLLTKDALASNSRGLKTMDQISQSMNLGEVDKAEEAGKVFDKMDFPNAFTLKVIGKDDATFTSDILDKIGKIIDVPPETITHSVRKSASKKEGRSNFISVTVTPIFQSGEQIYEVYDAMNADDRVQFVL